jgi:hypothetical protein
MNIIPDHDIVPGIVVFLRCRSAHHMSTNGLSLRHRRHIVVLDYDVSADIVVQNYSIVVFCYNVVVFCYDVVYWCRSLFALLYHVRCTDSQPPCCHAAMQPCNNAAMHHATMPPCRHTAMPQVCLKLKCLKLKCLKLKCLKLKTWNDLTLANLFFFKLERFSAAKRVEQSLGYW